MHSSSRPLLRAALAAAFSVGSAFAQSVFVGAGGTATEPSSGNWNTAANWENSTIPTSGNTASLSFGGDSGASGYVATNSIPGTFTLNTLTLASDSFDTVILAGNALQFDGTTPSIQQTGFGEVVVANDLVLAQNTTASIGAFASLTGAISGTGSLTVSGGGFLDLSAPSTYTGGTIISNGLVHVSNSTGSALGTGAILVDTNAALGGDGIIIPGAGNHVTVNGMVMPGEFNGNFNPLQVGNSTSTNFTIDGGVVQIELCGCGEGDLLSLSGALILNNATLNLVQLDTLANTYTMFTFNSITGTFGSVYHDNNLIADPTAPGAINGDYHLVYGANSITLVPSAIPEPGTTAALLGLAALGLVARRRYAHIKKSRPSA